MKARAVIYLRQSVAREESISLELQETACRTYANQHGYGVVAVEADPGISGRTWNRPAVQRVMGMVEAKEADVIILWKWSRLSRSRLDWAVAADRVETAGGRIESATEAVDVSTSTGRLARGMLTEFAAFESERIGDTWKEAHARRVRNGLPANGKPRFGYQYDRDTGFTPDPVTGPVLQEMYRRYNSGESFYSLVGWANAGPTRPVTGYGVSQHGMWSARTLRRVLDNAFAAGYITHQGQLHPGAHEPLITPEEWATYRARRETRRVMRNTERSPYLLSGMIRCACGSPMNAGLFGSARQPKYRCKAAGEQRRHTGGYVTTSTVEPAVLEWLREFADGLEAEASSQRAPVRRTDPTKAVAKKLLAVEARLDSLTLKLIDGTIPQGTYERLRDELMTQKATLESAIIQAQVPRPDVHGLRDTVLAWDTLDVYTQRDTLSRLINYVEVTPGRPRGTVRIIPKW